MMFYEGSFSCVDGGVGSFFIIVFGQSFTFCKERAKKRSGTLKNSQYAVITIYKVVNTCKVSTNILLKNPMNKCQPF